MSVVWLIRHGESQSNVGDLTYSSEQTRLTETGRAQAREIVKAFRASDHRAGPSHIITSKNLRSQQTAQPTIKAFPHALREPWPVHEFIYLPEEKTFWTTTEQRGPLVQQFWDEPDPDYSDGPESFRQFINRVYSMMERLRYDKHEFTAVFTHGQFIQALLWLVEARPSTMDKTSKAAFTRFGCEHSIPAGAIQELYMCGREEVKCGKLITGHLSSINSYPSRYVTSLALT